MGDQANDHVSAITRPCENCGTALQGHYCHICGQSTHSPVRHVGHAIEEIFESFWHLDGRVFRTLRDLLVPGRTAVQYLAGHRARYIPPLRMFVVLSLLAFFIGKMTVHLDVEARAAGTDISAITKAQTEAEVREAQKRLLAGVKEARREMSENMPIPGLDAVLIRQEIQIRGEADNRIAQLRGRDAKTAETSDATGTTDAAETHTTVDPEWEGPLLTAESEAWDPQKNPVRIGWLPDFANDWLTRRLGYAGDNIKRMDGRPDLWLQAFMASLPSALFVLVPVFALLLKLAYLFKRRLYLEHMVAALYSHCFLLLALAVIFLLGGLGGAVATTLPWLSTLTTLVAAGIGLWAPLYLLLMQKRVYGQGWSMTLLKYAVVGWIYFWLLAIAASLMFIVTLAKPI